MNEDNLVFIRNLPASTTYRRVKSLFKSIEIPKDLIFKTNVFNIVKDCIVEFSSKENAKNAVQLCNLQEVGDNTITVRLNDPETKWIISNKFHLLVVTGQFSKISKIYEAFSKYGELIFCEITEPGEAHVQFRYKIDAEAAQSELNGSSIGKKKIKVSFFTENDSDKSKNVLIRVSYGTSESALRTQIKSHGEIECMIFFPPPCGVACVVMKTYDDAVAVIEAMNGRRSSLKEFKKIQESSFSQNTHLVENPPVKLVYVQNISYKLTKKKLNSLFSKCGEIISASICKNKNYQRYAIIEFDDVEAAKNCIKSTLTGKLVDAEGNSFYVSYLRKANEQKSMNSSKRKLKNYIFEKFPDLVKDLRRFMKDISEDQAYLLNTNLSLCHQWIQRVEKKLKSL